MSYASIVLWKESDCLKKGLSQLRFDNFNQYIPKDIQDNYIDIYEVDFENYYMFYGMWNDYFDGIYDIDDRQDYLMNYKKNFKGIKWDQKYNGPSEALIEDILLHGITAYHCISVFSKIEENSLFDINKFSYVWGKSKRVTLTHEEWFNHCYLYGNEGYTYKIVND